MTDWQLGLSKQGITLKTAKGNPNLAGSQRTTIRVTDNQEYEKLVNDQVTYQLGRTRVQEYGKSITHSRHTIDETDQNNIIVEEGRPWIREEVKHR